MSRRDRAPLAAALVVATMLPAAAASAQDEPVVPPSTAQPGAQPAQAGKAASPSLVGKLGNDTAWRAYRSRFITDQGRVVDTANGQISHSEGQGYGMLLAVAAGDR
ncbi:MAG: glycosyl hydrolase family 8, partial [Hyphomicrobiales bacterium]